MNEGAVESAAVPKTWAPVVCAWCFRTIGQGGTTLTVSQTWEVGVEFAQRCKRCGKMNYFRLPARRGMR